MRKSVEDSRELDHVKTDNENAAVKAWIEVEMAITKVLY
jgi:hypothetical protein